MRALRMGQALAMCWLLGGVVVYLFLPGLQPSPTLRAAVVASGAAPLCFLGLTLALRQGAKRAAEGAARRAGLDGSLADGMRGTWGDREVLLRFRRPLRGSTRLTLTVRASQRVPPLIAAARRQTSVWRAQHGGEQVQREPFEVAGRAPLWTAEAVAHPEVASGIGALLALPLGWWNALEVGEGRLLLTWIDPYLEDLDDERLAALQRHVLALLGQLEVLAREAPATAPRPDRAGIEILPASLTQVLTPWLLLPAGLAAIAVVAVAVVLHVEGRTPLVHWDGVLSVSLSLSVALGAIAFGVWWVRLRRLPHTVQALFSLASVAVAVFVPMAALVWVNVAFDPHPVAEHDTMVILRGIELGDRHSERPWVALRPWVPDGGLFRIPVTRAHYDALPLNGPVTVSTGAGGLGFEYWVHHP
ncbi:MAG: hypothetical protein R2724_35115 [Bryobacterales bacterium]